MERREPPYTDGGNVNWYSHYGRRYGDSLKTRNKTAIWPSILTLGTYPEETKLEKDTCIPLFIAALFTTARTWKQPRCPLTDEWIKKLWYVYTVEYYSSIKRNAFGSVLMRCINLETIIQSEVSQKEKDKYCILASQWTWVWVNSRSWWWTGRPSVLWFIGLQRVGHDWVTELNWTDQRILRYQVLSPFSLLPRNFGSLEKTLRRIVRRFSDHSWGNLVREWTQLCLAWQKKSWICSNLQFWDHRG